MQYLAQLILCLHLLMPFTAHAQDIIRPLKDPFSYTVGQYGVIFAISILGGIASWLGKVRRKEVETPNLASLVGELTISAFAGLMTFYACEAMGAAPLVTIAFVGMAGHMGAKLILMAETPVQKFLERFFQSRDKP